MSNIDHVEEIRLAVVYMTNAFVLNIKANCPEPIISCVGIKLLMLMHELLVD